MLYHKFIDTPLGMMRMGACDGGICLFDFLDRHSIDTIVKRIESIIGCHFEEGDHPLFDILEVQASEYFAGTRQQFDLPLYLAGTDFQKIVWNALLQIPYGETRSYKQQSQVINNQQAIRAVASANGDNGIAILVPCHRVIGSNGSLTGYGGGLQRKQWLLDHERKHSGGAGQGHLF